MSVGVIGAGAFGTALAVALASKGPVTLWARNPEHAATMRNTRQNAQRLPGVELPADITVSAQLETVLKCNTLLFAVPTQRLRRFLIDLDLSRHTAVACCKGIEVTTGVGPTSILSGARHAAALTGPSFADDIARGLPTALTLACADSQVAEALQAELSTPKLRLYRTSDVIGAELGGALKNVIAIGCGAVMGAGLGDSARAALLTRGFAEMQRVAVALGAQPETLMGLSGLGDLTLTCTSDKSRNYRLGLALGAGTEFDAAITVEGAGTARALRGVAAKHDLDLPICATVADLVDDNVDVPGAMARLMARPLKEE
ncbi:NAD(P)-dependent glycerol-3-phosphate dehydrogenase [Tateyamaria omphalii]|uniref:NAD(P)H-dependent glycerol-3-phosphate dehydrogenase n=1 Tax=Tateyamaria omphalii TaxID=299262 RepID=UPI001C997CCF|nr:NAD(P)H-dependent glycerol-3-phosphate dehydrogenase [Tateyamaria omphalii]MBY5933439.1 NAD(P)-dependent glycerol-3-phosphate dehydrogenase [Tateyamaria omphalii]